MCKVVIYIVQLSMDNDQGHDIYRYCKVNSSYIEHETNHNIPLYNVKPSCYTWCTDSFSPWNVFFSFRCCTYSIVVCI